MNNVSGKSSESQGPSILMVDSDLESLKKFSGFFKSKGYTYIPLRDPRAILNQMKINKPDVLFIDIHLDQMRGDDVVRALRKQGLKLPIFVISRQIDKDTIRSLLQCGVNTFFTKNTSLDKVELKLRDVLRASGLGGKLRSGPPSILVLSDDEAVAVNFEKMVPNTSVAKFGYKVLVRSGQQSAISVLKNPSNNIRLVLVDAFDEEHAMVMTKLMRIIETKLKIKVFFVGDTLSGKLKDGLSSLGFEGVVSRTEELDLEKRYDRILAEAKGGAQKKAAIQRTKIVKDLKTIKSLPPLPDIYLKIESLAQDKNATAADYGKILELDPGITARLLRMSNSALYSFKRKIKSVKDAVALMGSREILSLVRLACVTGNLKTNPDVESYVRKVWQHSATCAVTAGIIYQKTDFSKEEGLEEPLFISGIIHDIGKIVLWKFFPEIYLAFILNPEVGENPNVDDEEVHLGTTHADVGRILADHWGLPEMFRDVITFHHRPKDRRDSDLVILTHIANSVSRWVRRTGDDEEIPKLDQEILESIGYTEDTFRDLTNEVESDIIEKSDIITRMILG